MLLSGVPQALIESHVVVGVEQTSKGRESAENCGFPVVGVFCSAAKKKLEPSIVAETVWQKLEMILPQACATKTMAVCGLGNVGKGLADFIISRFKLRSSDPSPGEMKLVVFDPVPAKARAFQSVKAVVAADNCLQVFQQAEVIFGCVGEDLTAEILKKLIAIKDGKTRYLVSCSSFDIEFASLLKLRNAHLNPGLSPFDLAQYRNPKGTLFLIPQAGFPITFDRAPSAAPIEQMQMTRGLLLAGLLDAAELANSKSRVTEVVSLNAGAQIKVVDTWRKASVPGRDANWFAKCKFHEEIDQDTVDQESQLETTLH